MSRFISQQNKAETSKRAKEEGVCRWCGLDVKRLSKARRTFCSDACVHEFSIRSSSSYIRQYIAKRDKYKCQICGLDCKGFLRKLWTYVNERVLAGKKVATSPKPGSWQEMKLAFEMEFFQSHNMEWVNTANRSTFYDIDHIVPVVEGGHQCGEENLRTLCLSCHRKETKELRKRLSKAN